MSGSRFSLTRYDKYGSGGSDASVLLSPRASGPPSRMSHSASATPTAGMYASTQSMTAGSPGRSPGHTDGMSPAARACPASRSPSQASQLSRVAERSRSPGTPGHHSASTVYADTRPNPPSRSAAQDTRAVEAECSRSHGAVGTHGDAHRTTHASAGRRVVDLGVVGGETAEWEMEM